MLQWKVINPIYHLLENFVISVWPALGSMFIPRYFDMSSGPSTGNDSWLMLNWGRRWYKISCFWLCLWPMHGSFSHLLSYSSPWKICQWSSTAFGSRFHHLTSELCRRQTLRWNPFSSPLEFPSLDLKYWLARLTSCWRVWGLMGILALLLKSSGASWCFPPQLLSVWVHPYTAGFLLVVETSS